MPSTHLSSCNIPQSRGPRTKRHHGPGQKPLGRSLSARSPPCSLVLTGPVLWSQAEGAQSHRHGPCRGSVTRHRPRTGVPSHCCISRSRLENEPSPRLFDLSLKTSRDGLGQAEGTCWGDGAETTLDGAVTTPAGFADFLLPRYYSGNPSKRAPSRNFSAVVRPYPTSNNIRLRKFGSSSSNRRTTGRASSTRPASASDAAWKR